MEWDIEEEILLYVAVCLDADEKARRKFEMIS
jgi:hypothetical protein